MKTTYRTFLVGGLALAAAMGMSGCATVSEVGAGVAEAAGVITPEQGQAVRRTGRSLDKAFESFTPEQEHYLGRAVGATLLTRYNVYRDETATAYLNLLGQSLAMVSDKPLTYKGYAFLILDSEEINAFAAPGGFIFVTRGMLALCETEAELAAVLAHEIGHVQHNHALKAIRFSRGMGAVSSGAADLGQVFASADFVQLMNFFGESVTDMVHTLAVGGYSRGQEREADRAAVTILARIGYDPAALIRMLEEMDRRLEPGGLDFAKTHPPPSRRIADVRAMLPGSAPAVPPAARQARFERALGHL